MTNPHEKPEDPEDHIGEQIPDPWDDDDQPDWPNYPEVIIGGTDLG